MCLLISLMNSFSNKNHIKARQKDKGNAFIKSSKSLSPILLGDSSLFVKAFMYCFPFSNSGISILNIYLIARADTKIHIKTKQTL